MLFVALRPGISLTSALRSRIGASLRTALSPRHVPDAIIEVPAIPHNRTGKKLEVPVKRILQGQPVEQAVSRGSVVDPSTLDAFHPSLVRRP